MLIILAIVSVAGANVRVSEDRQAISQDSSNPESSFTFKTISGKVQGDSEWWVPFNIEAFTKNSNVILIGSACSSPEPGLISINRQFIAQEVIKGSLQVGDTIRVSLPRSGTVIKDKNNAETGKPNLVKVEEGKYVRKPVLQEVRAGKRYLLFLSNSDAGSEAYILTEGPSGLFEISADDSDMAAFLQDVRQAVSR